MKQSLRRQITMVMCCLVAGAILLCWILNSTLLESYYVYNKERVLKDAYQTISEASKKGTLESDDFYVTFENLSANGNLKILIKNATANDIILSSSYDSDTMKMDITNLYFGTISDPTKILTKNASYMVMKTKDMRLGSDYLSIYGKLSNGDIILMRTPLESIHESVLISNRFLGIIGAVAVLASILIGAFLTKRITQPIKQLTNISERMVELDFNAKYVRGAWKYEQKRRRRRSLKDLFARHQLQPVSRNKQKVPGNEIDQLGDYINRLSSNLEKTISELKSANVELQKDIDKKIKVDEIRKEFLSNVSHELKTPLALIQGYAEGLQECINDDQESRDFYCDVIVDEADKMNRMVKKLLTLNQLEFGNEQIIMERFNMTELIQGVVNSTHILMQQKNITLKLDVAQDEFVWADEFKIEEVVTNYVSNAVNHCDGDQVIRIFYTKRPDNKLRVSVFNTGKPIPQEDIDQIWIKFYKVDKARTREYGGSGIGLSIVKAIMDSFNQECGAVNHENGVEFWFELGQ